MNNRQFFLSIILASVIGGLIAIAGVSFLSPAEKVATFDEKQNASFVNWLNDDKFNVPDGINFVASASQVTPAVVHIKSTVTMQGPSRGRNPLDEFFEFRSPHGDRDAPQREGRSSGSGVILSEDGYIVTNNHVIENAKEISVTLHDNTRFNAKVIGADPTTDLALLKIEASNLPFVPFGDSDNTQVGEWVLAVGNPFDLTSTVTAGIVSAKARNIGILRSESNNNLQIESFIQTDAVVNRGNSGGALVNLAGELVGINTAIASQTGVFSGYAFAVPSSIVKKVMDDLLEYGAVQRGLLGIKIQDISPELGEYLGRDFSVSQGVYVAEVNEGSGGEEAGLKSGDVIVGIDGERVTSVSRLQELVARKRPGDKVNVKFIREGKENKVTATLKNISGTTKIVKREEPKKVEFESVTFEDVEVSIRQRLRIDGGAVITKVDNDKWIEAGAKEGFIITYIGRTKVLNAEDLSKTLSGLKGDEIMVLGVYPNGQRSYFEIQLD